MTGEFPAQMASNAENVFIWWRHHALSGMYVVNSKKCQIVDPVAIIHQKLKEENFLWITGIAISLTDCIKKVTLYITIQWRHTSVRTAWITDTWWCHQQKHFLRYWPLCGQSPVTRRIDVFFDLRLKNRLNNQSSRRWFETLLLSLWRHGNEITCPCPWYPLLAHNSTFGSVPFSVTYDGRYQP